MRENLTYGLTRVQGKQALIYVLRPCPTLQLSVDSCQLIDKKLKILTLSHEEQKINLECKVQN